MAVAPPPRGVCRCVHVLLLLLLLLGSSVLCTHAQYLQNFLNPRYRNCLRNGTGPPLAAFLRDLAVVLQNFTALSSAGLAYASSNPLPNSTAAMAPYAMFQCRADLSRQSCSSCVQYVASQLPKVCPTSVGARLGTEGCLLRYDNESFFHLDTAWVTAFCNPASTTDVVVLKAISNTMLKVTTEAPQQRNLFADAKEAGMYAAAQCWAFLNQTQCSQCLTSVPYPSVCDSVLGGQTHLASCMYRYEDYNFLDTPAFPAPPPTPTPSSLPSSPPPLLPSGLHRAGGSNAGVIGGSVTAGAIVIVGGLCGILVWLYRSKTIKGSKCVESSTSLPKQLLQNRAVMFSLKELQEASGCFDSINVLGRGAFGTVFKGRLANGREVAIKKLSVANQRKEDFVNEVIVLTSVQHRNLIQLLGCCVEGPEKILVYDYVPNKSLDGFLFETRKRRMLSWSARFGIVAGMAKGLSYLHEDSHLPIIHRDIKPGNVLLDEQFNPVIADFGLAKLVDADATHINTRVTGTKGYLAPEYAIHGNLTEKADVYSYGVVCLEIVTGKKNKCELLAKVWEKYQDGHVLDVVDASLAGNFSPEQVHRVVHIALLCTQDDPKRRPSMSTVFLWLHGTSEVREKPVKPRFNSGVTIAPIHGYNNQTSSTKGSSSRSTETSHHSVGVESITSVEPR